MRGILEYIRRKIILYFFTQPIEQTSRPLEDRIAEGSHILDLGCGSGSVGLRFAQKFRARIVGTDIQDVRQVNIPFVPFDGIRLSFPDDMFDFVLVSFVLHHVRDPRALLAEARRVCRRAVIVYEDVPFNRLHAAFAWRAHNFFYSMVFGGGEGGYKTECEWENIFKEAGLPVLQKEGVTWFHPFNIVRKVLFVLAKGRPTS